MAMLSAAGVRRDLIHAAGQAGILVTDEPRTEIAPAVVDQALGQLAERSLLTFTLDGQVVVAHRLVLRVIRDQLAKQGRLAPLCQVLSSLLDTRAAALVGSQDRVAIRDVSEQVTSLRNAAAGLLDEPPEELTTMMLRLRLWTLYHLNELGDSAQQAVAVGEPLIGDFERVLGPDHPDMLNSRNNLANAYQAAGRAVEAIPLHQKTFAALQRVLGPDHPDTLSSRNNLALAYQEAGRPADAIPLHEQALAALERVLGPDHPDTLSSRNNLANAYQEAGRADEAIRLHEKTLTDRERVLGPDHPDTLSSRNNLAFAYQEAGRPADAIPLHQQVSTASEPIRGRAGTLSSRSNLANPNQEASPMTDAGRQDTTAAKHLHPQRLVHWNDDE
jgi:tetratricopeptide (TPR) repeat protein